MRKLNRNNIIFGVFWVSSLIISVLLVNSYINSAFPINSPSKSDLVISLSLAELTPDEVSDLQIEKEQKRYLERFNINIVSITTDHIHISPASLPDDHTLCIEDIVVLGTKGAGNFGIFSSEQKLLDGTYCFTNGVTSVVTKSASVYRPVISPNQHFDRSNSFSYPFDSRSLSFVMSAKGYTMKQGGEKIPVDLYPAIDFSIDPMRWVGDVQIIQDQLEIGVQEVNITLQRFLIYRILFFAIPLVALLAIANLHKLSNTDTKENGGFWEVTVGLLLGLWGVHEVMIPSFVDSITIFDLMILNLYLLLAIIIVANLLLNKYLRDDSLGDRLKVAKNTIVKASSKRPPKKSDG